MPGAIVRRIRNVIEYDDSQVARGAQRTAGFFRNIGRAGQEASRSGQGFQEVNQSARGAADSIEQTDRQARRNVQSFGSLERTLTQVAATYLTLQGAQRAFESAFQGARVLELEAAFGQQVEGAGQSVDEFLGTLDRAASGTISDFDLMQNASRAMALQVTSDAEQMAQLLEVARFRGRKLGVDTSQAFEDIVTGIGRASPLILDNLGIIVDSEKVYGEYAKSIGKSKNELTKLEQTQALTNAVISEGQQQIDEAGGIADNTADSYRQLAADVENTKNAWLTLLAVVGEHPVIRVPVQAIGRGAGIIKRMQSIEAATEAAGQVIEAHGDTVAAQSVSLRVWAGDLEGAREIMGQFPGALEAFNAGLEYSNEQLGLSGTRSQSGAQQLDSFRDRVLAAGAGAAEAANDINEANVELHRFIGFASQATGIDLSALGGDLEARAKKAREILEEQTARRQEQVGGVDFGLFRQTTEGREQLAEMAKDAADERVKAEIKAEEEAAKEAVKTWEQANQERLQQVKDLYQEQERLATDALGSIQSAVSESLDLSGSVTDLEMLQAELGTYTDGVDENIRRLKAVGARPDDPLLQLLPEDIQGELRALEGVARQVRALEIAQETKRGLRPELINVDALVREAEASIIGRRNLQQVQNEAVQRLVDKGFARSEIEFAFDQQEFKTNIVDSILDHEQGRLEARMGDVEALADDVVGTINGRLEDKIGDIDVLEALLENMAGRLLEATQQQGAGR